MRRGLGATTFVAAVLMAGGLVMAQTPASKAAKPAEAVPRTP